MSIVRKSRIKIPFHLIVGLILIGYASYKSYEDKQLDFSHMDEQTLSKKASQQSQNEDYQWLSWHSLMHVEQNDAELVGQKRISLAGFAASLPSSGELRVFDLIAQKKKCHHQGHHHCQVRVRVELDLPVAVARLQGALQLTGLLHKLSNKSLDSSSSTHSLSTMQSQEAQKDLQTSSSNEPSQLARDKKSLPEQRNKKDCEKADDHVHHNVDASFVLKQARLYQLSS